MNIHLLTIFELSGAVIFLSSSESKGSPQISRKSVKKSPWIAFTRMKDTIRMNATSPWSFILSALFVPF